MAASKRTHARTQPLLRRIQMRAVMYPEAEPTRGRRGSDKPDRPDKTLVVIARSKQPPESVPLFWLWLTTTLPSADESAIAAV